MNTAVDSCERDGCCSDDEEGNAICIPTKAENPKREGVSQHLRAGALFVVGCITSPCCTPLIVPLIVGALAGTPAALWIGANAGWVYGGLTLISVISFVLAWWQMNRRKSPKVSQIRPSDIPVLTKLEGEKAHVE